MFENNGHIHIIAPGQGQTTIWDKNFYILKLKPSVTLVI